MSLLPFQGHACNPKTWEVEARGPEVQGQSQLSESEATLDMGLSLNNAPPNLTLPAPPNTQK